MINLKLKEHKDRMYKIQIDSNHLFKNDTQS